MKKVMKSAHKAQNKKLYYVFALCLVIAGFSACENTAKDTTPPIISETDFLPADCDIYYLGDTLPVHFVCADDSELGNFNIEIHNNFDHHTHGTSSVDCEEEVDEHHDEDHDHEELEGAWVYNQDFSIGERRKCDTIDLIIRVPAEVLEGDYHFMVRLTDKAGWQSIKSVPIHLREPSK